MNTPELGLSTNDELGGEALSFDGEMDSRNSREPFLERGGVSKGPGLTLILGFAFTLAIRLPVKHPLIMSCHPQSYNLHTVYILGYVERDAAHLRVAYSTYSMDTFMANFWRG